MYLPLVTVRLVLAPWAKLTGLVPKRSGSNSIKCEHLNHKYLYICRLSRASMIHVYVECIPTRLNSGEHELYLACVTLQTAKLSIVMQLYYMLLD